MIAEKLRKAVLQAAIQGKLTEQLPEDGDARDLLKEIQQEKARLVKEGKLKKEKPLPEITEDEIPFDIPDNWSWVRLGDIAEYRKGPFGSSLTKNMFIPDGDNAIKVYEQKNAIKKNEIIGNYFIQKSYFDNKMRSFEVGGGDIIISCAGTIGESYILPANTRTGIINQALMRVRTFLTLNQKYFLIIFDYAINKKEARGKGSAIKNIPPFEILKNLVVPIPPIPEQIRIINQLEEIFVEIEKLEADESKLDALEKAFPQQLKNAILQAAIQGKLTQQLPEDGNARDLLKQIRQEKASLIKAGKLKKEKPLPPITEDDLPFDIPDNWVWVRLGDLINVQTGKKDANWGSASGKYNFYTCAKDPILSDSYSFEGKSIIMPGNGANVGLSYLIDEKFEAYQRTYVLQAKHEELSLDYIQKVIAGDWKRRFGGGVYGSAIPYIRLGEIVEYSFPLPPLAEQQRIVERLEELLPLCEKLE